MRNPAAIDIDLRDTVSMCSLRAGAGLFGIETTQIREVLGTTSPQRVPLAPELHRGSGSTSRRDPDHGLLPRPAGAGAARAPGCVLVLDERGQIAECFGLLVDSVGGVVTLARNAPRSQSRARSTRAAWRCSTGFKMPAGPDGASRSAAAAAVAAGGERNVCGGKTQRT